MLSEAKDQHIACRDRPSILRTNSHVMLSEAKHDMASSSLFRAKAFANGIE